MPAPLFDSDFMKSLEQLTLVSKKLFAGRMKGERRSKSRGMSVEFADYRDYALGDDPRFIDWNVYGRLDRLFLKLFVEEEDLSVSLLLDASASMGFGDGSAATGTKLRYAARVAGALGYIALANLDRVTVGVLGEGLEGLLPSARGRRDVFRLFRFLEAVEPKGKTDLKNACRAYAVRHRRRGLVVLLSDFMDPGGYEEALRALLSRRVELVCLQVLAPDEANPTVVGDMRLKDSETEDHQDVTMSADLRAAYGRNLAALTGGLRSFCLERGAIPILVTTDQPVEALLHQTLRSVGLLA
ncbi:MAG: DUF58 domain-containing protein [Planctomycetales bacterium]|nr:DUF58 domain-containing protein [Planctomycetales bacterium]